MDTHAKLHTHSDLFFTVVRDILDEYNLKFYSDNMFIILSYLI